jgi:spore germination protein YaaH
MNVKQQMIREMALTDAITNHALNAFDDFEEAVCSALLAHAVEHKRLIDRLVEAESRRPVVLKLDGKTLVFDPER